MLICGGLMLLAGPAVAREYPVDNGTVTSGVGWRLDPFGSGRMVHHNGIDIAVPVGTPVYPTQPGKVLYAGLYKGYGNVVVVDHGNGYISIYGHNSLLMAKPGQQVEPTTVIALSGNSGRSTGPHVHYEVRQLPGYEEQQARLEKSVKAAIKENIDRWVEDYVSGKGGPEPERYLPADLDE